MPFFKDIEIKSAEKYGHTHMGIFAKELIQKDEKIFQCDEKLCDFLLPEFFYQSSTSEQVNEIFKKNPDKKSFIRRFMYMVNDDMYDWPIDYINETYCEPCALFNHR